MDNTYSSLSASEINQLKQYGNYAEDWSKVQIKHPCSLECVRNNSFYGEVYIGQIQPNVIEREETILPEGIYNSMIRNAIIGDHMSIQNVRNLADYEIEDSCVLFNIDEMIYVSNRVSSIEPMNECGGRKIYPFPQMRVADAYLWAKYRDKKELMGRLLELPTNKLNRIGEYSVIKNCRTIRNVAVCSSQESPSRIEDCVVVSDGVVGCGCRIEYGCIVTNFLLGENVHLERGLRLSDTVVGDNSTIACCEVGNSMIFPSHEQHHNNSFLIASLVKGQSNIAAGSTIGSNHNGRTADNEIVAGRGFWPGLCSSFKHSSVFSSYCLLSKADYPYELNIKLPFSLVNNNVAKDQLEVMPAYWWLYNMYALDRNSRKYAARDKRVYNLQHIEYNPFAPDTIEEIIQGHSLLKQWISNSSDEVLGEGMENSKRRCVILKPQVALSAYEDMMIYYAMQQFPDGIQQYNGKRETRWVNLGGQLVKGIDFDKLVDDIISGKLSSWDDIHTQYDQLWQKYVEDKREHAYHVLCHLAQTNTLTPTQQDNYIARYEQICEYVKTQVRITREKDAHNVFRQMTYDSLEEMSSVLGD